MIHQLLTILEKSYLGSHFLPHGHRNKMSAFLFPFSTVFAKNLHAENLVRFFFAHPLVAIY